MLLNRGGNKNAKVQCLQTEPKEILYNRLGFYFEEAHLPRVFFTAAYCNFE